MYAHVHGDNGMCCYVSPVLLERYQAHRALELLEDYHAKLTRPQDKALRLAIERVIRIFKSRLFQALLALLFHHHGRPLSDSKCSGSPLKALIL
ncbi:hypothetical protein M0804_007359 [Polistes exclamans]|nr:hypothetical protein M0804_007359 [Polistes exclamans]